MPYRVVLLFKILLLTPKWQAWLLILFMNWRLGLFMNSDRVSGQTSTQHKRNILDAPKPTYSRNQWRRVHKVSRNTCPNSSVLNVKNDTITDHTYLTPFLDAEAYPMTDIFPNSPHRCGQTYRKGPHHHVFSSKYFFSFLTGS